jgi:hypothetical protein
MNNTAMSKGKEHLRVVKTSDKGKRMTQQEIPWKTIALTSAIASVAGFGAVELAKYLLTKPKKEAAPEPQSAPNPMAALRPGGMPALPGAISPNMFQNPYAQMQAMQGFPAPFANPMVVPEPDEPPKWFEAFKEEYDKDQQRLANLEQQTAQTQAAKLARNVAPPPVYEEDEDEDEYEE